MPFFQYVVCDQGGTGGLNFLMGWYPTEGESSNFWACRETPSPVSSLSGISWSSHKENPEKDAQSVNCWNDFEKSEWEYFPSKQQSYSR